MIERLKRKSADGAATLLAMFLRPVGPQAYRNVVNALWERQPIYSRYDIRVDVPELVAPEGATRSVAERVFEAYCRAKRDQQKRDPMYLPAGGWQNVVDAAFGMLSESAEREDFAQFHYFLANFGAWPRPTGIEESSVFRAVAESVRKRRHFENQVIAKLVHWWETQEGGGRSLAELSLPSHGNQAGLIVNGTRFVPNAIYSDFYARLLGGMLPRSHALVAELGGGYGRLAYFLTRAWERLTYVGLDLPECLACASYYLMLSFPDKRVLLYGESALDAQEIRGYDFVFWPSFDVSRLPDASCDLFLNENSLGVMPPHLARHFVTEMCRIGGAIWHRNHELRRNPFPDGGASLINSEYPIPTEKFRLVARCCDVERLVSDSSLASKNNDMYWYFYAARTAV